MQIYREYTKHQLEQLGCVLKFKKKNRKICGKIKQVLQTSNIKKILK